MKTKLFLSVALLLIASVKGSSQNATNSNTDLQQKEFTVVSTPELYQLASALTGTFNLIKPANHVNVINSAANTSASVVKENQLYISNTYQQMDIPETSWNMIIGRNILVPIFNAENPFAEKVLQHGISAEKLAQIINNPEMQNWGTLVDEGKNSPLRFFVIDEENARSALVEFTNSSQLPTTNMHTEEEMIAQIQKDPLAIGFCNVTAILGKGNQGLLPNIRLMPIDKNGNGKIDHMEDIYSDINVFLRGVWIGKYPKSLYSSVYLSSNSKPSGESELAFLNWVLTDGQQLLNENGYCELINTESQAQLDKINTALIATSTTENVSKTGWILVIIAMILTLGMIITAGVRRYRKQQIPVLEFNNYSIGFDDKSLLLPQGLYYDKTHTWAFMEKDGNVTIGIDDFVQHITGPITRIELKKHGEKFKKGDILFSIIQAGKQLNMYAPVSGTVKESNDILHAKSSLLNTSPYADGWVYKIEPSNWVKEVQLLDMADKYKKWIHAEFVRMKDFIAVILKPGDVEFHSIVLQDGGELKEGVLSEFGPEVWEDFQTNFLDTFR